MANVPGDLRDFVGSSDGEKRGEVKPDDLGGNLLCQLGSAREDLNRHWHELNTRQVVKDRQRRVSHPVIRWMATTLDGVVEASGGGLEVQIHAAVVVLGRGDGRKTHGTAAA